MRMFIAILATSALAACTDGPDNGPPNTFGDCGASVCEVSLSAFTRHPGTIPYCRESLSEALAMPCTSTSNLEGSCEHLHVFQHVYGPPGDNFTCVYDEGSGDLVGAKWAPDAHPVQQAGVEAPASCMLTELACADGGAG